jgi:hypothetical protein
MYYCVLFAVQLMVLFILVVHPSEGSLYTMPFSKQDWTHIPNKYQMKMRITVHTFVKLIALDGWIMSELSLSVQLGNNLIQTPCIQVWITANPGCGLRWWSYGFHLTVCKVMSLYVSFCYQKMNMRVVVFIFLTSCWHLPLFAGAIRM